MIIYGTKGTHLKSGKVINVNCPNCSENSTMNYSIFGKYAHVYWIPFFPYTRLTFMECNHCKMTFEERSFTDEMKTKLGREKEKSGKIFFPFWMFSGVILVGALTLYGFYKSGEDEDNLKEYLKNPKKGDVYHIKLKNEHFSSIRVDSVSKDSLDVTFNDYETDLYSGIDDIDVDKNYTSDSYRVPKTLIIELKKKDSIYDITRK